MDPTGGRLSSGVLSDTSVIIDELDDVAGVQSPGRGDEDSRDTPTRHPAAAPENPVTSPIPNATATRVPARRR